VNVADSMVISILSRPVVISPAFADVLLFWSGPRPDKLLM
jgi:hypothetical protein